MEDFRRAASWSVALAALALALASWTLLMWPAALGMTALLAVTAYAMVRRLRRVADGVEQLLVERELTAAQLSTLAAEMELILDAAPDGIYGVNLEGRVLFANRRAAELLGIAREELFAASIHELLHADEDEARCALCRAMREGEAYSGQQDRLRRPDGTSYDARCASTPMRKDGQLLGAVVSFADNTGQRRVEQQLRDAQKLTALGQLAAGVAHEINTPTQYVKDNVDFLREAFEDSAGLLDKLRELRDAVENDAVPPGLVEATRELEQACDYPYLKEEVPKALAQSQEGLSRVASIVRAMKELAHPGDDRHAPVDLNHVVDSAVTVARNEWKYVADLDLELDPNLPPVSCNAAEISQTLLNLLVNAAHAISEVRGEGDKGRISVRTEVCGQHVRLSVRDTGAGIPAGVRDRVFEPFFTTKEVGRGTGQGLALAYDVIVQRHGGRLFFDTSTEPPSGTTFTIELPVAAAEVA